MEGVRTEGEEPRALRRVRRPLELISNERESVREDTEVLGRENGS